MRIVNVFLSLLVSLVLALLVFEGGLRLIGLGPPDTGLQHDEWLGWSKKPNYDLHRKTDEFDIVIETNEFGLRGEELASASKPEGTFRVATLGDSFTLGFTVAEHELFVDQLDGWWNSEGRSVDVVNAGTQGYSTDQAVLWLERNGSDFAPDLVMLFPYENDIYWNGEPQYGRSLKPLYSPKGVLETAELAPPPSRGFLGNTAIGRLFESKGTNATFVPEGGTKPLLREFAPLLVERPEFLADAEARTKGSLIALQKRCQALGAKLVVAPIPSHSAVDPANRGAIFGNRFGLADELWDPNRPVDFFLGLCKDLGIATVDARPALRERQASGEALYYKIDWHLNPTGNLALAEFLHDALDGLGVFPAQNSATRAGAIPPHSATEAGFPTWAKLYLGLWLLLTVIYSRTYREDPAWKGPIGVAVMLGLVFTIIIGGSAGLAYLPPKVAQLVGIAFVIGILGFVTFKLGRRLGTIAELLKSFTLRGHWYLMPLVVVLLTIGSLLVVAASSPLVAPFIYTLF